MNSLIEKKFTTDRFEIRKSSFFKKFGWGFLPFAQKDPLPDPELLVPHQIEEVQELIDLVKEGDLISFIVSGIGLGKTTLSSFLAEALPQQRDQEIVTVFLYGPSIDNRNQMLKLILERLELQTKDEDISFEFEQLRNWHENYPDLLLVLIVDEFPDISKDSLNLVRTIADLEGIVWVLNGCKDELLEFVSKNAEALLERKRHVFELEPMDLEEIKELLLFRMAWARGGDYDERSLEPFTEEAVEEIYSQTEGNPRRTLKLAGDSIYNAIEEDRLRIGKDLIYYRDEVKKSKSFWSFLPFFEG